MSNVNACIIFCSYTGGLLDDEGAASLVRPASAGVSPRATHLDKFGWEPERPSSAGGSRIKVFCRFRPQLEYVSDPPLVAEMRAL